MGQKYFLIVWLLLCGRHGDLMVSALDSGSSGRVRAPAYALRCVLGQDTLLSQYPGV